MKNTRVFHNVILLIFTLSIFTLSACQKSETVDTTPSSTPEIIVSDTSDDPEPPDKGLIGIFMMKDSNHSVKISEEIKKKLEDEGYTVELKVYEEFSEYYIEQMAAKGCKVMVFACTLSNSYFPIKFKEAGFTVFGIDIYLIDNLDYFVSFDMFRAAGLQAEYIVDELGLKDGKGPFNIELFSGGMYDGNIHTFYRDAMETLRPYIGNGRLVVRSGEVDMREIAVYGYEPEYSKARMERILADYYTDEKLDAVLCPVDFLALGVIDALTEAGYTEYPIITGADCYKPNIMAMKAGKQSMTVFYDRKILIAKLIEMIDAVMTGREVPVNDIIELWEGKKVPAFLCEPIVVTVDNIKEVLIDGGYYTEADLEE